MSTTPTPDPLEEIRLQAVAEQQALFKAIGNISHDDLVLLTSYLAEHHYPATELAYAVEKPWKYSEELEEAQAERDEEGSREILPLERQYPKTVQS